jgi:hypothetical protein
VPLMLSPRHRILLACLPALLPANLLALLS